MKLFIYIILFDIQNADSVFNGLFQSLFAVFVNFGFVLFAVGKATGTADAATDTSHTFNEVDVEHVFALFKQSCATFFNTVTRERF